jgi:hypothetical protein
VRRIVLGIIVFIAGCGPASKPAVTTVSPPVAVEAASSDRVPSVESLALPTNPVIRRRSPEQVRQRIQDTVARMDAQAESRRHRQALQQVAAAMVKYRQEHQQRPQDSRLSWRVALLPFLGEQSLYSEFHHDEPWDSPHNQSLVSRMPKVFGDDPLGLTRLVTVVDDDVPSSVLLIESRDDQQETWTQPRGMPFEVTAVPERIALRDGSVCHVDQQTALATWQEWLWTPSDELPSWIKRIPARTAVRAVAEVPSEKEANPRLRSLPADALCAISIQPRKLLANPHVNAVLQSLIADSATETEPTFLQAVIGPVGREQFTAGVAWLKERGIDVAQLESVTMMVPAQVLAGPVQSSEMLVTICRVTGSIDVEGVIAYEMESLPGYRFREQGASAGVIHPQRSFALHFADETTIVVGGQLLVQKVSDAQPDDSKLTAWLTNNAASPLVMAADAAPLQQMWQQRPLSVTPPVLEIVTSLLEAEGAVLTLNPDADEFATLTVSFRQAAAATQAYELWNKHIEQQRALLPAQSPSVRDDIRGAWFSAMMTGFACQCHNDVVRFTITRPDAFEELVHALTMPAAMKK